MTEIHLFGTDNGMEMPTAFLTDHQAWDDYISSVWAGVIENDISNAKTIVEIGPGVSTKIGGALKHFDFNGTLYVVDVLDDVIQKLKPIYQSLLPHAKIIWITGDIETALPQTPDHIDLVLGNHILDDMMIFHLAGQDAIAWSSAYKHHPDDILKNTWNNIKSDTAKINNAKENIANTILSLFQTKNIQTMILNQYPSATLKDHAMHDINTHACDILNTLKSKLKSDKNIQDILNKNIHYKNNHIGNHVLNAEYWITCRT